MQREKYRAEDFDQLLNRVEEGTDKSERPALLVFDFDGVLSSSEENNIYKMAPEPNEGEELSKIAKAWNMNLKGYDVPYQRHLLFQAAAAQLKRRIASGMTCSIAKQASLNGHKVYILSARSGIYAIKRMHEFLEENGISPIEVFHVGRVSKEKQLALLLGKFPDQDVFYFEDESRHIDDIETAFIDNPQGDRLHLLQIEHDATQPSSSSLRTIAWSVLRGGFENKLGEGHMDLDELRKIGLEHGRQLFIYHAGQRVQSIGHYFAALAFLTAAAVTLLTSSSHFKHQEIAGIALCVVAFIITLLLWGIDTRNARLVQLDENLIKSIEGVYGSRLHTPAGSNPLRSFQIMDNAEKVYSCFGKCIKKFQENDENIVEPLQYKYLVPCVFSLFVFVWFALGCLFAMTTFNVPEPLTVKVSGSLEGGQIENKKREVPSGPAETSKPGAGQSAGHPRK